MNDEEKRDRQMIELLNELRVALPGVQFLLAFLLTVPFAQGFERVTSSAEDASSTSRCCSPRRRSSF